MLVEPSPAYLVPYYALYLQDDWKVSRKFTLNLGLRYDFFPAATERYDRVTRGFDATSTSPIDSFHRPHQVPRLPDRAGGGDLFAGPGQSMANIYRNTWQPRIGGAWQLSSKLVLRGGLGRFMVNPSNDWLRQDGFTRTTSLVNSVDDGRTPLDDLITNPFPSGVLQPPGRALGLRTLVGEGINFFDPDFKISYVNHFSFGIQYQLPLQSRLEVSYLGSRSYDVQTSNSAYDSYSLSFRQQCNRMEGGNPVYCDALQPNPFDNLPQFAGLSMGKSPTLSRASLAAPFPQFTGITELGRNDGRIWYNSMVVTYKIRAQKGLNLTFSYTLSKEITQSGYSDILSEKLERSPTNQDRPHVVKISNVYQLPFGRGRTWLSGAGRLVDTIAGGWEHTLILNFQCGLPWAPPAGTWYVRDGKLTPDWTSPVVTAVRRCVAQVNDNGSISLMSYSASVSGCTLDNYNFLRLPRYAPSTGPNRVGDIRGMSHPVFDMSLAKTFTITERMRFQFRGDAFNVFNSYWPARASFNSTITSSSFGQLTLASASLTQAVPNRQIQLGLKFIF